MQQAEIQQTLIEFISGDLLNDQPGLLLKPEDDLLSSQLVDSLGVMRIVAFLEQQYDVTIPPADVTIENFIDVKTIGSYIERRRSLIGRRADS